MDSKSEAAPAHGVVVPDRKRELKAIGKPGKHKKPRDAGPESERACRDAERLLSSVLD